MKYIMFFVLVLIMGMTVIAAEDVDDRGNPNDPATNERANACFGEGSMADDLCDTEWEWTCGWYLIRYEQGILASVPDFCTPVATMCIANPTTDLQFTLPPFFNNATAMAGGAGTCDGVFFFKTTIVAAANSSDAAAQCAALGFFPSEAYDLSRADFPSGYYQCGPLG